MKEIINYAKLYGFINPSSEIYGGLKSIYDYSNNGINLKNNIKKLWWRSMTNIYNNIIGIDSSILTHANTLKASGHIDNFNEIMIDNKISKKRYCVDDIIKDHILEFLLYRRKIILYSLNKFIKKKDLNSLYAFFILEKIKCSISKTLIWSKIKEFNLMFNIEFSNIKNKSIKSYLRPETAQGIFLNFYNIIKVSNKKIPFGIAQIGKAFRNEIISRQFIFRMKEFEQMEMQFFIQPEKKKNWFNYWNKKRIKWYLALDIKNIRIKKHEKLSHYCDIANDIEYKFPFGYKEVEGIHSRRDFDLKNHQNLSKKKIEYFDPKICKKYIPYVIETSAGCDRLFLMILYNSLTKEKKKNKIRLYLKINKFLSPVKVAIFPLVKNISILKKSYDIFNNLKNKFNVVYEENKSIGKRYINQDLIGTPYCLTIDYRTLYDNTITIRERDTMIQKRMKIDDIYQYLFKVFNFQNIFDKI